MLVFNLRQLQLLKNTSDMQDFFTPLNAADFPYYIASVFVFPPLYAWHWVSNSLGQ